MEYVSHERYEYIMNKYHAQDQPFGAFGRFIRNDALFDEETGLSAEKLRDGILKIGERQEQNSHALCKAHAFSFVLDNMRIRCDARDPFPALNAIDRPLSVLTQKWKDEVFGSILPDVGARRSELERNGIVTIWPDYDHIVPVWDRVFSFGFRGLRTDAASARQRLSRERVLTKDETDFFDSIDIAYAAIERLLSRLTENARKNAADRLADALTHIAAAPPDSFYEMLLVDYLYFMLSEHIEGLQVRSLGNFDRLFFAAYERDLARGVTEASIREDLAAFFLQFTAIGNYWNQPVYLGGCKADGSTEINDLSYLFLDVYDKMGIYNPKIQIKYAENTPKDFTLKALDMIRRGHNCIVFVSDSLLRAALVRAGHTEEDARTANIAGCYEYGIRGGVGEGMKYMNLLKPLEYAMHEGCDGVTGAFAGRKCPKCEEYVTFDEFYAEYKAQLLHIIEETVALSDRFAPYLDEINPQPMLAATIDTCLSRARGAYAGGGTSNGSTVCGGFIADLADSLTVIRHFVFEEKRFTLAFLRDVLDQNYEGYEQLRRELCAYPEKYGNNKDLPDFFAADVIGFFAANVCGRPNTRNGKWNASFHVARMSYTQGKTTAATPNGRRFGEELSKNCSASMGQSREGATAAILSVTKIDASAFTGDAALDLGLLPSAVKGDDGLQAMYGLLTTFVRRGGHAMHINVFDAETLREAQKHPEKYADLQIRVCGWNVLWNNINKEEQDGFIRQAEALV